MKTPWLRKTGFVVLILVGVVALAVLFWRGAPQGGQPDDRITGVDSAEKLDAAGIRREALRERRRKNPRFVELPKLKVWWDGIPQNVRHVSSETGPDSNIHRHDYSGPQSCQKCHAKNYEQWSQHPHRRMNALATTENVFGDFSGSKRIEYLGGEATFFQETDGGFRMRRL